MQRYSVIILFISVLCTGSLYAQQKLTPQSVATITEKEDSLKLLSMKMVFDEDDATRLRSDSLFVRGLVRALLVPHSFYYPFDSLNVSRLYAPDSSFRIFTWQIKKDAYVLLQKGAIQMRTEDGSLKLFPLHDQSMFVKDPVLLKGNNQQWIGAIYYRVILKEWEGKKYYTLIGFDDFSINSNKKFIEVLYFENGTPMFGGPFFQYTQPDGSTIVRNRHVIEYKEDTKAFLNYDEELDIILVDHLISESDEPEKKSTYVPDGDYEAFKWEKGKWVHIDKYFDQALQDGEFPRQKGILSNDGTVDEKKLMEQSIKNMEKAKKEEEKKKAKEKPPKKNDLF